MTWECSIRAVPEHIGESTRPTFSGIYNPYKNHKSFVGDVDVKQVEKTGTHIICEIGLHGKNFLKSVLKKNEIWIIN